MSSIEIDLDDPTPPYEQIRRAIVAQIGSGALVGGDRLPTIRALARDLGIAPGTVGRAYKELDEAGLISTARAAGTRISPAATQIVFSLPIRVDESGPGPFGAPSQPDALVRIATRAVDDARRSGFSDHALLAAVQTALAQPQEDGRRPSAAVRTPPMLGVRAGGEA